MSDDWCGYAQDLQRIANADYERHKEQISEYRAEIARLRAALADERAHADALAEALKATAACLDMLPATAIACGANETAIGTAKSAEDYSETLDCAVSAIKTHRARRQG